MLSFLTQLHLLVTRLITLITSQSQAETFLSSKSCRLSEEKILSRASFTSSAFSLISTHMLASMKDRLSRAKICHECEFYNKFTKQCKQCGCLINLKISFSQSTCPINKWTPVKSNNHSNIFKNFIS